MKKGTVRLLYFLLLTLGFSNVVYSAPTTPVMVSPAGAVDSPVLEYIWLDQIDTDEFRMFVYDRSIRTRIHQQNYRRAEVCDGAVCRVTPDVSVGFSNRHQWGGKALSEDGASPYAALFFAYVQSAPGIITTVSPIGEINTDIPAFAWQEVADADSYRLFIADRTTRMTLHAVTYSATDVCSASLCQVMPEGLVLPENNDLYFRVRGRNSGGWGSWPAWEDRSSFTYVVEVPNQAPVANNDAASISVVAEVAIPVLGNDADYDGTLITETVEIIDQPTRGTATAQFDGSIIYVNTGSGSDSDSFTYRVSDDQGAFSNVATVSISIGAQQDEDVELADLDLAWAGYPLIADDVGKRLFMSLGEAYSSSSPLSGAVSYTNLTAGYGLRIMGVDIVSGGVLSGSVKHGDIYPVIILRNGSFVESYNLVLTNLPLFEVRAFDIVDEPKLPGVWRWVNGQTGIDTGVQNLGIEFRGGTSQDFDKKSFGFETRELTFPAESENVRFLDLRNDDDWIADAAYRDLSIVRNLVCHDIYRDMRTSAYTDVDGVANGHATIAGGVAEMILNGGYQGLYIISERVDRKLLGLAKIDVPEDVTGDDRWDLVDFISSNQFEVGEAQYIEQWLTNRLVFVDGYISSLPGAVAQ